MPQNYISLVHNKTTSMKRILITMAIMASSILTPSSLNATKLLGVKTIDKDYIMLHFRDGEFTPRETMRGKMALLGYLYGIRE